MAYMSYIFDFHTARAYEQWSNQPEIKRVEVSELRLMMEMLRPMRGKTVLEVGCGCGNALIPFIEKGLLVSGIDPSPYMLDIAHRNLGNRVDLYRGSGEDLPFEDNSYNYVCLNTSLEFVENHEAVIEEACRVAKNNIYVGILSRYALMKGYRRRYNGVLNENIQAQLRFYSIGEIKRLLRGLLGDVPVESRAIFHFPMSMMRLFNQLDQSIFLQKFPFGAYAGIMAVLVPQFITRPLALEYQPKRTPGPVPG
jgi:ubiquinone/menaquinone biosynthesis C-methylase UbiE